MFKKRTAHSLLISTYNVLFQLLPIKLESLRRCVVTKYHLFANRDHVSSGFAPVKHVVSSSGKFYARALTKNGSCSLNS